MNNEYKNVEEMSKDELIAIVTLIIELDKLNDDEQPEKQLEIVTAIQTLVRVEEAVTVEEAEAAADAEAPVEAEAA